MKKSFVTILVIAFTVLTVSCGGGGGETAFGVVDTSSTVTTSSPETTAVPALDVEDISSLAFTPGDYSFTLTWPAFDGTTGYDVYIIYEVYRRYR